MLRMVSVVTLKAGTDVGEVLDRLQVAVAEDGNIASAELGECLRVMGSGPAGPAGPDGPAGPADPTGSDGTASYALILGFANLAAFERYSAGGPHRVFADWAGPVMAGWSAALFEPRPPPAP